MSDNIDLGPGELDTDHVVIRTLRMEDLDSVVRIDAASTGIARREFYKMKIERSISDSSVHLSLAAEIDGFIVGFVTVAFYQGEFGKPEPTAVLDAIGVHPDYRGRKAAKALMLQLEMNLKALRVETIRTEVDWDQFDLLQVFAKAGFRPADRVCLEKAL